MSSAFIKDPILKRFHVVLMRFTGTGLSASSCLVPVRAVMQARIQITMWRSREHAGPVRRDESACRPEH
jgi:hypothetical protein